MPKRWKANMRTHHILPLLILLGHPGQVLARDDYRCKIERIHNAAGESNESLVHQERKTWIGKEFSVDRRTGSMTGALKNNYLTMPTVIDPGSKDNAFKAVATLRKEQSTGGGTAVFTLVINEYVEAARKPFVFLSNDVVYFGNCRHDK